MQFTLVDKIMLVLAFIIGFGIPFVLAIIDLIYNREECVCITPDGIKYCSEMKCRKDC